MSFVARSSARIFVGVWEGDTAPVAVVSVHSEAQNVILSPVELFFLEPPVIAFDFGPKFDLGRVVITANAFAAIPREDVDVAVRRHSRGDWGDLNSHDLAENERCLVEGGRLLSVYLSESGVRFYVLTESDRSVTTVVLPEDY